MAYKCILTPIQASYSVADGVEVLRTQLSGGMGRYRRDIINSTSLVNVSWLVKGQEFEYLRAFYKTAVAEGSRRFTIDLLLDNPVVTEHEAMFIPGSMNIDGNSGLALRVSAQLEVVPLARSIENDSLFIAVIEEFGFDSWQHFGDVLDDVLLSLPTIPE